MTTSYSVVGTPERAGQSAAEEPASPMDTTDFCGLPVVFFESRRAPEMASLVARHGGVPIAAPAMREVRSPVSPETLAFGEALMAGAIDFMVLLTGVGTRALIEELAPVAPRDRLVAALARTRIIVRGPKPAAVLRELGISSFVSVPSPNTFRELLVTLDATFGSDGLVGKSVAVQEYGVPNEALDAGLRERGARLTPVRVYTWALPEDTTGLRAALAMIARGEATIALFTSRAQVENAMVVASEDGLDAAVRASLARGVVASIGPVCSDALRAEQLLPDLEPTLPRMGHLVKEAAARSHAILAAKKL